MNQESDAESTQYQTFLRSLDDVELISHVNRLSQLQQGGNDEAVDKLDQSTPLRIKKDVLASFKSMTSVSSDPFDDGLDEVFCNIGKKRKEGDPKGPQNETDEDTEGDVDVFAEENDDGAKMPVDFGDGEENLQHAVHEEAPPSQQSDEKIDEKLQRHEFGDYATYFHNKHIKQQRADREYLEWDRERRKYQTGDKDAAVRKPIFEGCVIYVNGHTIPSINEIHRLVILHGGRFLSYLTKKGAASHIICDQLTPRKQIEFKNCRVVRAKWVVDCIAKGELLEWSEYRLTKEVEYGQKRLNFNADSKEINEESELSQGYSSEEKEEINILEQPEVEANELKIPLVGQLEVSTAKASVSGEKIAMDAKHPDFLKHFFENSRLHHLSTWKSDLRLRFLRKVALEKKEKKSKSQSKDIPRITTYDKVILHVDFDCFFATASCLKRPDLDINRDPIAVTHGGRTSDIASCNYVARKFGLRNGMWSAGAKKMCPQLIQLDYEFATYEKCSNDFYDYLISRGIFDHIFPVLIDEVLLDLTTYCLENNENIGNTENIVNKISQEIREDIFRLTKCSVSVGASHNVLLAKLALKHAKPNGQFYLHKNIDDFLDNILVKDLPGIGHSIRNKLVDEIGSLSHKEPVILDLKQFSEMKLVEIFGKKTGAKLYRFARGKDDTSIEIDTNNNESVLGRKSVSVDVNFGIRFDTVVQMETFLINISKELYSRLISLGLCGSSLTLRLAKRAHNAPIDPPKYLGMGLCDFVNKSSKLGVPTNDWGIIGSEFKALYRMMNIPVNELRGVAVTMNKLEDVENLKKRRQMRLPFNQAKDFEKNEKPAPNRKVPKTDHNPVEDKDIDWEVFHELPDDIKKELLLELSLRGIIKEMYSNNTSPSPSRDKSKQKAYIQQLFPTQLNGPPKYVRVIESPTKSPRKKQKTSAILFLPTKKEKLKTYNESGSYDDSIINELPSSLKREVLKDLEYKNKVKNFDLVTMREKLDKKYKKDSTDRPKITQEWVAMQPRLINAPLFLNQQSTFHEISHSVEGWIAMSMEQGGPHIDDVMVFLDYLKSLLKQDNLSRCLNLIKCLRTNLDYQRSIANTYQEGHSLVINLAIEDWNNIITLQIVPVIQEYCNRNCIDTII